MLYLKTVLQTVIWYIRTDIGDVCFLRMHHAYLVFIPMGFMQVMTYERSLGKHPLHRM
jgi:hypothetical protein